MDPIYQPAIPDRWADPQAIAKLSPSDPIRTLTAMHASIQPLAQVIEDSRAAIDNDPKLSADGKLLAKQAAFAEHVGGTIKAHDTPLRLAGLRVAEHSATLLKAATERATVSEGRMLAVASWLRDLDPDVRGRTVLAAINDSDPETLAAILAAPRIWRIATPAQVERAQGALMELHDPEKSAALGDMKVLIQAIHESHESLGRYARDKLGLRMPPARKAA